MIKIPDKLYKYRSLATNKDRKRTFQIIEDGKIFYSKFQHLNDPFDGNLKFDQNISGNDLKRLVHSFKEEDPKSPINLERFLTPSGKIKKGVKDLLHSGLKTSLEMLPNYGVLCLSENPSSILMWAHYSQFSGVAIEFSISNSILSDPDKILRVKYQAVYPKIRLTDFNFQEDKAVRTVFSTKYTDWSYEKEWRALTTDGGSLQDLPAPISSVILGPLIRNTHESKIRKLAKVRGFSVKKLKMAMGKYSLEISD